MQTDEDLMILYVREGDDEAFRELFERYAPRMRNLMHRAGISDDVVPDLVQKVFLNLHRARRDFDTDRTLRPWLYTIALNIRRSYFRKRGRRRDFPVEDPPEKSEPPREIERLEDAQVVRQALDTLNDTLRSVVELHWFEELTFREISEVLGISRSAAKVRAHRAYKKMRQTLEDEDEQRRPD